MFYPFILYDEVSHENVLEIWDLETLLYGVLMSLFSTGDEVGFGEFVALFGEALQHSENEREESPYSHKSISWICGKLFEVFQFGSSHGVEIFKISSGELLDLFVKYPELKAHVSPHFRCERPN